MEACRHLKMWIDAQSGVPISCEMSFSSSRLLPLGSSPALTRKNFHLLFQIILPCQPCDDRREIKKRLDKPFLMVWKEEKQGAKLKFQTARHVGTNKNKSHRFFPQVMGTNFPSLVPCACLCSLLHFVSRSPQRAPLVRAIPFTDGGQPAKQELLWEFHWIYT